MYIINKIVGLRNCRLLQINEETNWSFEMITLKLKWEKNNSYIYEQ